MKVILSHLLKSMNKKSELQSPDIFQKVPDIFQNVSAPIKMNNFHFNHNLFLNKSLSNAIVKRSRLKNRFNETRSETKWSRYKKQRNFRVTQKGSTSAT